MGRKLKLIQFIVKFPFFIIVGIFFWPLAIAMNIFKRNNEFDDVPYFVGGVFWNILWWMFLAYIF